MRGVFTAVWFLGVMSIGAVAGVELAHYRQNQLINQARASAETRAEPHKPEFALRATPRPAFSPLVQPKVEARPKPAAKKPAPKLAEETPPGGPAPALPTPKKSPAAPVPEPVIISRATTPTTSTQVIETPLPAPAETPKPRVRIVISLPTQRAFVFRDGELWDSSRVSTGKKGKRTPVGTFTILEKAVWHRSNRYSNAPMPYMERITWGGVALHAGVVPGYPASHGCIRLPRSFAKRLYNITNFSSRVIVTDKRIASAKDARNAS